MAMENRAEADSSARVEHPIEQIFNALEAKASDVRRLTHDQLMDLLHEASVLEHQLFLEYIAKQSGFHN